MKHTLVICGAPWHPAETARFGLALLCTESFDFEFREGDAAYLPEILPKFAVALLVKANVVSPADQRPWLTREGAKALQNHLRQGVGVGLVAIHAGTSRYESSSDLKKMIGGAFEWRPDPCRVTLETVSGHPLANGVTEFVVRDEHYLMAMNDTGVDVLLHSRSEHGVQSAGWTRTGDGGGRAGVLTPGHGLEVWQYPSFQRLLLNALRWTSKMN